MPGVEESIVDLLQKNTDEKKPSVSKILREGGLPIDLLRPYMEGIAFTQLDHSYEVAYHCPCNEERVEAALQVLGEADLQDMIDKKEEPEITCQMCGKPYKFNVDKVIEIRNLLYKNSLN